MLVFGSWMFVFAGGGHEVVAPAEPRYCHSLHSASRHRLSLVFGKMWLDKKILNQLSHLKSDILIREISVHVVAGWQRKPRDNPSSGA